jgi:methionyl-tRNA formyltransferase
MKYVFAGDRQISVHILKWIMDKGYYPEALIVPSGKNSTHADELINLSKLSKERIFIGNSFSELSSIEILKSLNVDYFIGIHFPYLIPKEVLIIPKIGFVNLHPSFLPYNKGWNTPSWAILDKTPYGATLHFMDQTLDDGDIIHQKRIDVLPDETANSLYKKTLKLEEEVFFEAFDELISLKPSRQKQISKGTAYKKRDLKSIQEINILDNYNAEELINKMRALSTNDINEAAFFIKDGKKIAIQIKLINIEN